MSMISEKSSKIAVHDYWNQESCGESLYLRGLSQQDYLAQARSRYELEPYIIEFAGFADSHKKEVLEIGVGLGADHENFVNAGAIAHGIDLTERAVEHTRRRLLQLGKASDLRVCDAEHLPYTDQSMDIVYSWGVIHHAVNPARVVSEIHRVLRPGGEARVMIYHKHSLVGWMLWVRYALFRLKPLTSLSEIYGTYLESLGTKAYTSNQAKQLFSMFSNVDTRVQLTHGDLLASQVGQRHRGVLLSTAKTLWPRWLISRFFRNNGLFLLITARK